MNLGGLSKRRRQAMKFVGVLASLLLVIGGINWGLIAIVDLDVVETLFGDMTMISRGIYGLVGLSAIYHLIQGKVFDAD